MYPRKNLSGRSDYIWAVLGFGINNIDKCGIISFVFVSNNCPMSIVFSWCGRFLSAINACAHSNINAFSPADFPNLYKTKQLIKHRSFQSLKLILNWYRWTDWWERNFNIELKYQQINKKIQYRRYYRTNNNLYVGVDVQSNCTLGVYIPHGQSRGNLSTHAVLPRFLVNISILMLSMSFIQSCLGRNTYDKGVNEDG